MLLRLILISCFQICMALPLPAQETNLFLAGADTLQTIAQRFPPPEGYKRVTLDESAFGAWLRKLPLLPEGSPVIDFRGRQHVSPDDTSLAAVTAVRINNRRLDQCMDIILRIYVTYLLQQGKPEKITLPLPDGLFLSWAQWKQGFRPGFAGSNFFLEKTAKADVSARNFERYLRTIFNYSGTQAFWHHFPAVDFKQVRSGDFIVKKGLKGHAVLIVDMVKNEQGRRKALVGQGDTPACQFYLLRSQAGEVWIDLEGEARHLSLPIRKKMKKEGLRRFP